ncbi:fimbrial protein [Stenotrophomonas cyclobalanopsidis]|uniref:fimbrial protein n=1 Tax=Stenotrophomonas cyclobalanopsidis TaxID=2771362 RepID=UPI0034602BAA
MFNFQKPVLGLMAAMGALFFAGSAAACEEYGARPDLIHDQAYTSYPPESGTRFDGGFAAKSFHKCGKGGMEPIVMRLEMPGLSYEGDISYNGQTYPAYSAEPGSPLMIFSHKEGWDDPTPLRLNEDVQGIFEIHDGDGGQYSIVYRVEFFSRGGRMRTLATRHGTIDLRAPARPTLASRARVELALQFPAATCPLQDTAENLQDVQTAELSTPGSTAKEKLVAIRMDCGVDPPRARMTLSDAGDAGNTGSQLTPTADSNAEGVRVQLLRGGSEVQFGQTWDFDPGVGGVHDHQFTARYIRTDEPLVPGVIKGEAVLNVDYW